ncbi:hypothetical protein ACIQC9_06565 [Brevundimonas sp. NPDC092305]|uniref:hypothetical protein n=1 Tax=Brevundimonas sp. NPDC092305 TaxID=3363957 RepID=UPI0037FA0B77
MCTVVVEPVQGGWTVNVEGVDNPMVFRSGRAAERAGRDLALKMAHESRSVRLELRLRGGAVAARFLVLAPTRDNDEPLLVETPAIRDRETPSTDGWSAELAKESAAPTSVCPADIVTP